MSFLGNGVWTHVNSKGKIPSTGKLSQRRIEPVTLWTASPNTTNELFQPRLLLSDSQLFSFSPVVLGSFSMVAPISAQHIVSCLVRVVLYNGIFVESHLHMLILCVLHSTGQTAGFSSAYKRDASCRGCWLERPCTEDVRVHRRWHQRSV